LLISLTQRENRVLLDDACGRRLRTGHDEIGHTAALERRGALDELLLLRGDSGFEPCKSRSSVFHETSRLRRTAVGRTGQAYDNRRAIPTPRARPGRLMVHPL